MLKKEFRYIRYRICRSIYYADQCPTDCKKNIKELAKNVICAISLTTIGGIVACAFLLMS